MLKKKNKVNFSLKLNDEYKEFKGLALMYAFRVCMKNRKQLKNNTDVKQCFDNALKQYYEKKHKKEVIDNA